LHRTKVICIVTSVSSMSPLIWIQPANLGGLFFVCIKRKKPIRNQANRLFG
jgi:hypothetical protein